MMSYTHTYNVCHNRSVHFSFYLLVTHTHTHLHAGWALVCWTPCIMEPGFPHLHVKHFVQSPLHLAGPALGPQPSWLLQVLAPTGSTSTLLLFTRMDGVIRAHPARSANSARTHSYVSTSVSCNSKCQFRWARRCLPEAFHLPAGWGGSTGPVACYTFPYVYMCPLHVFVCVFVLTNCGTTLCVLWRICVSLGICSWATRSSSF